MPQLIESPASQAPETFRTAGSSRRPLTESRRAALADAARLMEGAFNGNRRQALQFEEAMASPDFRDAAFEVLDREMLARYQELPAVWTGYAGSTTVRDFKPKRYVDLMGGRAVLDRVPELTEFPARNVSKALYELSVEKFGGRFAISWESIVNDELGELRDLPGNLAIGARNTEQRVATELLTARGTGAFFDAANGNLITGNPALTAAALEAALTSISTQVDGDGNPIVVTAAVLVVPPALQTTADRIVGATEVREDINGQTIVRSNPLAGRVRVVVDPWLTSLDGTANAATTWYLLPAPNAGRPALLVAFLRGYETPDLRVKADGGQRVGGGDVPATEGSFDIDDIQYRVRHVVGGSGMDPKATRVSNGSGA